MGAPNPPYSWTKSFLTLELICHHHQISSSLNTINTTLYNTVPMQHYSVRKTSYPQMESQKNSSLKPFCNGFLATLFAMLTVLASLANADVYRQEFVVCSCFSFLLRCFFCVFFGNSAMMMGTCFGQVQETKITRLCKTKTIITVNGQFPGPTIAVRNGDDVVVTVVNRARYNVTIHWYVIKP